ncbi:MAG TPA: L-2-hydroxyglutarate oxidase [Candidatus Nanopelagicales bacterium]|nr:L-2-hydroxyglutarate oxidase [Candidatus Nanopelagicales bacterium]
MTDSADLVVVGGGIVGLATAYRLLEARPALRLVVLEKEDRLAAHQTGRNSGVIHSPNTYAPGSLKARLCAEGKRDALAFADEHGIPYEICGELIVATEEAELPRLAAIAGRARANGVALRELGPDAMREVEPDVRGLRALHVPATGIIDWGRFALALADAVVARGGEIRSGTEVTAIRRTSEGLVLETTAGAVATRDLVACAGLHADHLAAMTGDGGGIRIVPFRGDYAVLRPEARRFCRSLIYPVPDPRFPFLGVHLTRRIDGAVWAGPNAVLAYAREGYRRRDVDVRELAAILGDPGFLRLAGRYWRVGGAEMVRDLSLRLFLRALRRFTPGIALADLAWGPSGIRAQALRRDGSLVEDFAVARGPHVLHVQNAPSPAATASLAIGRELAATAVAHFGL